MEGIRFIDIYATKDIEYLIAIPFLSMIARNSQYGGGSGTTPSVPARGETVARRRPGR